MKAPPLAIPEAILFEPKGFAHGFVVLSDPVECLNKIRDYYALAHERCIVWSDPDPDIDWRTSVVPRLSAKSQTDASLQQATASA